MKFMEKAKRFFTLKRRANDGFTLVELIVVIAILAILAGVAVPAYSGYIKKAEKAGDLQLLAAVNDAFAAACMAEGTQATAVKRAALTWDENCVVGISSVDGAANAGIDAAFQMFYKGNEGTEFKVLANKLVFANGVFVEDNEETVSINWGGKDYNIKQNSVQNYMNSVFYGKEEALAEEMDTLSGAFGAVAGADLSKVETYFGKDFADYIGEETDATTIGNKTALWIAQQTEGMTAQDAGEALLAAKKALGQNNGSISDISDDPLTTMSIMYGAITAYAYGEGQGTATAQALAAGVTDQQSLLALINTAANDQSFLKYVGSEDAEGNFTIGSQFEKDMNGFIGALDAVNSVSPGVNVGESDLWSNAGLADLLAGLQ